MFIGSVARNANVVQISDAYSYDNGFLQHSQARTDTFSIPYYQQS